MQFRTVNSIQRAVRHRSPYSSRPRPATSAPATGPARRTPAALAVGDAEALVVTAVVALEEPTAFEASPLVLALVAIDPVVVETAVEPKGVVAVVAATTMPPTAVEAAGELLALSVVSSLLLLSLSLAVPSTVKTV